MRRIVKWLVIFFSLSQSAFSQQLIEGKIVDAETKKPISFASIIIVGTSKGTSTNLEGEFTLSVSSHVSLKITCVGYESLVVNSSDDLRSIQLRSVTTQLKEVIVFNKEVNAKKIVRKAFADINKNYSDKPFLQKFFYRHYCKDDSVYGRLIEAFVDVWKNKGYHSLQKTAGENEAICVRQLRRSLDKTIMAQGHEPISVKTILQADVAAYQTSEPSAHISFYKEVSNLKTDIADYAFTFEGTTLYDGEEVYQINYSYKKDSALLTSGQHLILAQIEGTLFITPDTFAFVKAEEEKRYGQSKVHTSAYYRKYNGKYYPYHFIREGENQLADGSNHSFRIDLMSEEILTDVEKKFIGQEPAREELLNIQYDSIFWNTCAVLKTTPLENKIINDLGEGLSLNKQFLLYRQYELNTHDGGKNGNEKFSWFREFDKGKRALYLFFWSGDYKSYLADLEFAKRLQKKYRNKIQFVLLSLDNDEMQWQQTVSKYALYSDGIINYRIGKNSDSLKTFQVKETPTFILIKRNGEQENVKRPSDPALEKDFDLLIKK